MAEEPVDVEEGLPPEPAVQDDVSEVASTAKRRNRHKNVRNVELNDMLALLNTYEGRHFVWRLLEFTEFYSVYVSDNIALMSRNAGKRLSGAWVLDEMHTADPSGKLYQKMREEAFARHVEKKSQS